MTDHLTLVKNALQKSNDNKGKLLELIVCDILEDADFLNIHRQSSGSQYGFDLVATKTSEYDSFSTVEAFQNANVWKGLLPTQLDRKIKIRNKRQDT